MFLVNMFVQLFHVSTGILLIYPWRFKMASPKGTLKSGCCRCSVFLLVFVFFNILNIFKHFQTENVLVVGRFVVRIHLIWLKWTDSP